MSHRSFDVTISLDGFRGIKDICLSERKSGKFWFSWTFQDQTFHSNDFNIDNDAPLSVQRIRDVIQGSISIPFSNLSDFARTLTPIQFFLCGENIIVAAAEFNIAASLPQDTNADGKSLKIDSVWLDLHSLQHHDTSKAAKINAQLQISVQLSWTSKDPAIEAPNESIERLHVQANKTTPSPAVISQRKTIAEPEEADYDDNFDDDDCSNHPILSPPAPNAVRVADYLEHARRTSDLLRHYRVSVEVRSVSALRRPAHLVISFVYPHLGSNAPVRTHPLWVQAFTDVRIDGAAASYDCCMSPLQLQETLSAHPLKIQILSRSNLGSEPIGEVLLNLQTVYESAVHTFRCPLTKKSFRSVDEYTTHRASMELLRQLGRVEQAPPADPVYVHITDTFMPVSGQTKSSEGCGADGAKVRVVAIIEDIGTVGSEFSINVKKGYTMHNAAVIHSATATAERDYMASQKVAATDAMASNSYYNNDNSDYVGPPPPLHVYSGLRGDPFSRTDISPTELARLQELKLDWEVWQKNAEKEWREKLREKEEQMRSRLQSETDTLVTKKGEELKRMREETAKLELRLRESLDAVERQKAQLALKEEQISLRLAQKTAELQLLQRRVRDEAKARIDAEVRRADALETEISELKKRCSTAETRTKETEREFEQHRIRARSSPENGLREEISKLRAQLAETRGSVERERRIASESALEKEHYRAQMHRLALALKREREKSSVIARQELEQLRLEFLAREERYILDGDREELRTIRSELADLQRSSSINSTHALNRATVYEQNLKVDASSTAIEKPSSTDTPYVYAFMSPSVHLDKNEQNKHSAWAQSPSQYSLERAKLQQQLEDILSTGLYSDGDDVVLALRQAIQQHIAS